MNVVHQHDVRGARRPQGGQVRHPVLGLDDEVGPLDLPGAHRPGSARVDAQPATAAHDAHPAGADLLGERPGVAGREQGDVVAEGSQPVGDPLGVDLGTAPLGVRDVTPVEVQDPQWRVGERGAEARGGVNPSTVSGAVMLPASTSDEDRRIPRACSRPRAGPTLRISAPAPPTPCHRRLAGPLVTLFRAFRVEQTDPAEFDALWAVRVVRFPPPNRGCDASSTPAAAGLLRRASTPPGLAMRPSTPDAGCAHSAAGRRAATLSASGSAYRSPTGSIDVCYSSNVREHAPDPTRDGCGVDPGHPQRRPVLLSWIDLVLALGRHETSPWHHLGGRRAAARYAPADGRGGRRPTSGLLFSRPTPARCCASARARADATRRRRIPATTRAAAVGGPCARAPGRRLDLLRPRPRRDGATGPTTGTSPRSAPDRRGRRRRRRRRPIDAHARAPPRHLGLAAAARHGLRPADRRRPELRPGQVARHQARPGR